MELHIACAQIDIVLGDKEANLKSVIQVIHEAARARADILVLPELFNTGYCLDQASALSEKQDGHSIHLLRELASRFHIFLVAGSVLERRGKQIYNTCSLIGKDGRIIGSYDKTHLFPPFEEDKYLTPGTAIPLFKTNLGTFGVAICFDIRFPELTRSLTLGGAQVIFVPAEFPAERISIWTTLLQSRAIENQVFVVGCNSVGSDGKHTFGGRSAIIDPEGKILAQADNTPQLISARIDLRRIAYVREQLPALKLRRETLYRT
jgi:predicted amidohydrolase